MEMFRMSNIAKAMKYLEAKAKSEELVELMRPYCTRIMVAGSVRRERANPKDIELVIQPKVVDEAEQD